MRNLLRWPLAAAGSALALGAGASTLTVEVSDSRSPSSYESEATAKVKKFAWTAARLTEPVRLRKGDRSLFTLPVKVLLTRKGIPLPAVKGRAPGDLELQFEASGSRAFPASYRTLLQQTLDQARPAMNALFGAPKNGGVVKVLNYDADIQDRYAVAGGYVVPNAPGGPEIRFPIYNSNTSAAINFIHTLLLAYQGDASYFSDGWNEGLVRAATMQVARTPGSLPGSPGSDEVEQALDSLYDASESYDWNNQPGLASQPFIAPNLLNLRLPAGGSTGGPYLLRYQMAGTAWAKVLAEHPGFVAELNRRFYASPAAYPSEAQLAPLGQTALNTVSGTGSATVEGLPFSQWLERQAILDPNPGFGLRTVVQAFPIVPEAGTSDFGVFGLILHATRRQTNGDELLLSGRSYPVYWRPDNFRFFVTTQDDIMDVAGGFGSVAPNFPRTAFDGQFYRVIVDVPFQNQVARTMVPAGAVATGQNPSGNNAFGVLASFPSLSGGGFYRVRLEWTGGSQDIVVNNMAFGARIVSDSYSRAQSVVARVFTVQGSTVTEVASRRVSKGVGSLGLILRPATAFGSYNLSLPARIGLYGPPLQPYRPHLSTLLGLSDAQTLAATWNPRVARWDVFPTESAFLMGQGWIIRPPSATAATLRGILANGTPAVASLQPGWNLVSSPFTTSVPTARVQAAAASEFFSTYTEAAGTILGTTLFGLTPDPDNPDGGTYTPVTTFSPGQGVWVQMRRPEGGALAFQPDTAAPASRSQASQPHSFFSDDLLGKKPKVQGWEAEIRVASSRSHSASALVGQHPQATSRVDPKLDSDLPPSAGGLQARIASSGVGYRDIRAVTPSETWPIRLENLIPGRSYALTFTLLSRSNTMPRSFRLTDQTTGKTSRFASGVLIQFRASASTHQLVLTAGGQG